MTFHPVFLASGFLHTETEPGPLISTTTLTQSVLPTCFLFAFQRDQVVYMVLRHCFHKVLTLHSENDSPRHKESLGKSKGTPKPRTPTSPDLIFLEILAQFPSFQKCARV